MSILLRMSAVCDGCAKVLRAPIDVKQGEIDGVRWCWQHEFEEKKEGTVAVHRIRRTTKMFCVSCADKPQKP